MKITTDFRNAGLNKKDVAMLDYAEKITLRSNEINEDEVQTLREVGWSDQEILDIAALTCYRNFIARMADALGVELTEDYRNLSKDYVDALMVGKKLL